jgi:hypothetical protein
VIRKLALERQHDATFRADVRRLAAAGELLNVGLFLKGLERLTSELSRFRVAIVAGTVMVSD